MKVFRRCTRSRLCSSTSYCETSPASSSCMSSCFSALALPSIRFSSSVRRSPDPSAPRSTLFIALSTFFLFRTFFTALSASCNTQFLSPFLSTPFNTLFIAFNMMLGMGDSPVDSDFDATYEASGPPSRSCHLDLIVEICY